jgi:hypothetical protein
MRCHAAAHLVQSEQVTSSDKPQTFKIESMKTRPSRVKQCCSRTNEEQTALLLKEARSERGAEDGI